VEALEKNEYLRQKMERCFEINGLWLDKHNTPVAGRFRLYFRCMYEAIRLTVKGKTNYVYAYSAENQKLRNFYTNFRSTKIYEGKVKALHGMTGEAFEVVELGEMKRLPVLLLRNPLFLLTRMRRQRRLKNINEIQAISN